ncbi:MAG: carbohydrate kinase [Bacteroidales bacterium]|nr:carbohydrate kinase [Candidatus Cryptobacteroides onthequi]
MYSLGIDVGTSSVKVSLLDIETGICVASATNPKVEAPIKAACKGWAEQDPDSWWTYLCDGVREIAAEHPVNEVKSIGITYQMHGLVCVDKECRPVRDAIIWCDSRAIETGAKALEEIGYDRCMSHLLNSPGNFTASKLAWVRQNEPELYSKIYKFMLPGDYMAYKFSGEVTTTETGLSEGILWDFAEGCRADFLADHYGIEKEKFATVVPSIGVQCRTDAATQALLGIPEGTPICYRAGDQPNNAFSLNVLNPGEIAATGGTSGVVYGVTDVPKADPQSRVNTFLHVNNTAKDPRLGVLLCINGTGIMNSWMHRNVSRDLSYPEMNALAATAPAGSDGLSIIPFGNGAERVLGNRAMGSRIAGLDLVRHSTAHMLRAAQEGIAFSFMYGIEIMQNLGLDLRVIRAGKANMFLSPVFRTTLATLSGSSIELLNTDGSLGAARGGALGAGYYACAKDAFADLTVEETVTPEASWKAPLEDAYALWKAELEKAL